MATRTPDHFCSPPRSQLLLLITHLSSFVSEISETIGSYNSAFWRHFLYVMYRVLRYNIVVLCPNNKYI